MLSINLKSMCNNMKKSLFDTNEIVDTNVLDINELFRDHSQLKKYNTFKYSKDKEYVINIYFQDNVYSTLTKEHVFNIIKQGFAEEIDYKRIFENVTLVLPRGGKIKILPRNENELDILIIQMNIVY